MLPFSHNTTAVNMDIDSDEDTETQIKDLQQLTAVLEDESIASCSGSKCSAPASAVSLLSSGSKVEEYSRIETALALNKLTDMKLQRLEKILANRLSQCRDKLEEIHASYACTEKSTRPEKFKYINCGKPYFKDSNNFPAPDNSDTILMKKSGMYDFSCVASIPGWTVKDKSEFISSVLKMSKDYRVKELNSKIAEIRRDTKIPESQKDTLIDAIKAEISTVSKKPLKEVALPIEEDYDWDAIANKLNNRHSAQEYASLWKLFLHPSINKEFWSKTEHLSLQRYAHSNNLVDWDKIAKSLNTKRTGYQCFVYFRTNMSNTLSGNKWTKEEEEYLKRLIEYYREDNYIPWARIAASMENRTKIQIYNKYLRLLEIRKGRFLPEEDAVILTCIEKFGRNFKKIKEFLPGRSHAQLRYRYQVLQKKRISSVWTVAEDKKLIQLMANQDSTTNFANITKFFVGKDRVCLRARYLTLMKWMKRNPNVDLFYAPRRAARRLCHGQATANLNIAIDKLNKRMQSELETKKPKRITKESVEEDLDEAIVAVLTTIQAKEAEASKEVASDKLVLDKETTITHGDLNAINLKKALILLKASLVKDEFMGSKYSEMYPELLAPEQQACLVRVKSYSRKPVVNTIKVDAAPSVWGDNVLKNTEYVFPPHYGTITGCRALLSHITAKESPKVDLNILRQRNILFREHMYLLMERFNTLFLWPTLLSNEAPATKSSIYWKHNQARALHAPPLAPLPSTSNYNIQQIKPVDEKEICDKKKTRKKKRVKN